MTKSELRQLIRETIEEAKRSNEVYFNDPILGKGSTFVMSGNKIVGEYIINGDEVETYNYITDKEASFSMGTTPTTERILKYFQDDIIEDVYSQLAYEINYRTKDFNKAKQALSNKFTIRQPDKSSGVTKAPAPKTARRSRE